MPTRAERKYFWVEPDPPALAAQPERKLTEWSA